MTGADYNEIISSAYRDAPEAERILRLHSEAVAGMAVRIASRIAEADTDFVLEAAMLHDIGIIGCDAPSIGCHGCEPYIRHGLIGAEMLEALGLPRHARVCARHTGAGLTADEIAVQNLPLPHTDLLPETLEERIICYADKFFSKSGHLLQPKPIERVMAGMAAHGEATAARFAAMHREFGEF